MQKTEEQKSDPPLTPLLRSNTFFSHNTIKEIQKIKPFHPKPKYNEIYYQSKRPIFAYIKRAKQLFFKGEEKITIFAMGKSIQKAVRLVLMLKQ